MGSLIADLVDAGAELLNGSLPGIVVFAIVAAGAVQPEPQHNTNLVHGVYAMDPLSGACTTEACGLIRRLELQRQDLRRTLDAIN